MSLFSITSLIVAISSIVLSLLLYRGNEKNSVTFSWLLASIFISLWSLGLYGVTSSGDARTALHWQYLLDVAAIFLPVFYFNFASVFLGVKNKLFRNFSICTATLIAIFSFSSYFKIGVIRLYDFYWVQPGKLYFVFPVFFTFYIAFSLFLLIKGYVEAEKEPLKKAQIRNTLLAGVIGFSGGITNFLPQFLNFYPFGNYLVILYVFLMSYGVLKHKLFSVKVISAQLFSGGLVLIFLFNLLRPSSFGDWIINFIVFLLVLVLSALLLRSVINEIGQRERIERLAVDLEQANQRLKDLDQQKSEFVSLASHQLRGPLTAIKGYASMLIDGDFGEVPAGPKEAMEKIYKSTQDLVVLVGDYLNVSRIEQGRMEYDFTIFDLQKLVTTVVSDLKPTIETAHLTIDFDYNPSENYMVNADIGKIKQVIGNLIDNSIKYTPHGGIHVWLARNSAKKVLITISDTGVGIKPEVLPRLFEKFTRAPDASKTNIMGTGLGLYVAKKMIEAHDGKVWAESAGPGKGSSFFIELSAVN